MRTIEIRSWLDQSLGYEQQHEIILWKKQGAVEVRDALYPGMDMVRDVTAAVSLNPEIAEFCDGWRLKNTFKTRLPEGRDVYLVELP